MRPIPDVAAYRPMERPNTLSLRCPGCGSTGFVKGLERNTAGGGFSWLFSCDDCARTYAVSTTGRRA